MDALDEYSENSPSLNDLLEDPPFFENFSNKKIIYTTRLYKEFEDLSKFEDEYIRLLPCEEKQVNNFLQQKRSDLTYQILKDNHIDEEIIKRPLILSILVDSFPKLQEDFERINEKNRLTPNLTKTLIYMQMFYDHYYGKIRKDNEKQYSNKTKITN